MAKEGNESVTSCYQLKMQSTDGKYYNTDVADTEQVLRLIQSIPSKKAEPFKMWLAKVGSERIDETLEPEQSIERAIQNYRRLRYSENWINQRIKSIEVRKALTDEWDNSGVEQGKEYAALTDLMTKTWSDMTTREYKKHKDLTRIFHTVSTDAAQSGISTALRLFGRLDILSNMSALPVLRAPCIYARLHSLAAKPYEISGLCRTVNHNRCFIKQP